MAVAPPPFRFTSRQYHRLGEAGVLPPDARLELVHGEILNRSPIGPRHSLVTKTMLASGSTAFQKDGIWAFKTQ